MSLQVSMAATQNQNPNATVLHGLANYHPTSGETISSVILMTPRYVFHLTSQTI